MYEGVLSLTEFLLAAEGELTYVVPRSDGVLVGGTAIAHDWDLQYREETTKAFLERARRFTPELVDAPIIRQLVGLRPSRSSIRLELTTLANTTSTAKSQSASLPLIHNYGHGGAGWTMSWGCAEEVLELTRGVLGDSTLKSKL